ncbi:hypothetical protein [Mariniphaga sp.]|uniref:hypothetical protein n=1 Tax=Mariniphaga sp. TaxID=1954475 RepID=UPI003566E900
MENKKLVKILLKDMGELEELIAEIKTSKKFDALEMEFVHTRARGILQLLQLFGSKNEEVSESIPLEPKMSTEKPEKTEKQEVVEKPVQDEKSDETDDTKKAEQEELHYEKPKPQPVKSKAPGVTVQEETENKETEDDSESKSDDDMLEEEIEKVEAVSRLGDSFLKGKSVNDLINDQNKLEFKLSNRPVSSIQSAIGINDRFLYIRELFDGDNQKFLEAVKALDSKPNIKEAVEYLRNNFKWKRNETSLKFVNLVKRRFINE